MCTYFIDYSIEIEYKDKISVIVKTELCLCILLEQ